MHKEMILSVAILSLIPALSSAAIYQCEIDGQPVFSDSPCGEDSTEVEVNVQKPSGMRLDTNSQVEFYTPERRSSASSGSCPSISSTKLNTLAVRNQVVRGMKPADVRRSWGSPTSVRSGGSSTQWAYHWASGSSSYVYFRGGCVSSFSGYKRNY